MIGTLPGASGGPGTRPVFSWSGREKTIALESKVNFPLRKGDRLVIHIAGGGGYGDPRKRARKDVERDLSEGLITEEEARESSGSSAKR